MSLCSEHTAFLCTDLEVCQLALAAEKATMFRKAVKLPINLSASANFEVIYDGDGHMLHRHASL